MMYKKLAVVISINAVIMFLLTYVMVDEFSHFYLNIHKVHMAFVMAAPMFVVMLLVMRSMYGNKQLNNTLIIALRGLFLLSMIPPPSSATLMCQEEERTDPEIITLCEQIIETQREESDQMKAILERSR